MSFQLSGGRETRGFVLFVEDDSPIVFIDIRRAEIDEETKELKPSGRLGGPSDLTTVDLTDVEQVVAYSGMQEPGSDILDKDEDEDEEEEGIIFDSDLGDWGD